MCVEIMSNDDVTEQNNYIVIMSTGHFYKMYLCTNRWLWCKDGQLTAHAF